MSSSKPQSILVVEDEELLLAVVVAELEEEGFHVLQAQTAEAALAILKEPTDVDVLFTDIRLPGQLNGWRLAEQALTLRDGLPVVYATGFTDEMPKLTEKQLFFTKPYKMSMIIEGIRRLSK